MRAVDKPEVDMAVKPKMNRPPVGTPESIMNIKGVNTLASPNEARENFFSLAYESDSVPRCSNNTGEGLDEISDSRFVSVEK
jgi:hypothetical protein